MATPRSGSRALLWLLVGLVVLASSAAAVAIFMMFTQQEGGRAQAEETEVSAPRVPIFVEIAPFTVNLADDDHGARLLYAGISLKVADEHSRELFEMHMPQVRSRLLTLLSGQQAAELTSPDGKRRLAEQITDTLEAPMSAAQPEATIVDVLFTEFIVQ